MNKFWVIFKSEYAQVVRKKSFLFGILFTPAFMVIVTLLPALLADRDVVTTEPYAIIDADGQGISNELIESIAKYRLEKDSTIPAYELTGMYAISPGERHAIDSLRIKLDSQVLSQGLKYYIVLYPGALQNDSVLMVSKSLHFRTMQRMNETVSNIMAERRLEHSDINIPVDTVLSMTRRIHLMSSTPGGKTRDFDVTYLGGLVFVMIVSISVIGFGGILMRSIIEEKNSRVMEVLVSSVSPFQLMMGKILGLGAASLTQIVVWISIGGILFANRATLNIPEKIGDIIFNPILIVFFVLYLIIAYFMYAALFAFVGSICTTDKETQNFMFPITMSLMIPIFIMTYVVQEPESFVTLLLSFIPLFTPTMMVLRLNVVAPEVFSLTDPIILESVLGLITASLFTAVVVWLTARVFRIGILMYGKRATLPEIIKWIRYK